MNEDDFEKIDSLIARHIGVFTESINHKFDILVEGQQMLSEKVDRVEKRLDEKIDCVVRKLDAVAAETSKDTTAISGLSSKIDGIAADLSAHRADTEAHHPVFRIKE